MNIINPLTDAEASIVGGGVTVLEVLGTGIGVGVGIALIPIGGAPVVVGGIIFGVGAAGYAVGKGTGKLIERIFG